MLCSLKFKVACELNLLLAEQIRAVICFLTIEIRYFVSVSSKSMPERLVSTLENVTETGAGVTGPFTTSNFALKDPRPESSDECEIDANDQVAVLVRESHVGCGFPWMSLMVASIGMVNTTFFSGCNNESAAGLNLYSILTPVTAGSHFQCETTCSGLEVAPGRGLNWYLSMSKL